MKTDKGRLIILCMFLLVWACGESITYRSVQRYEWNLPGRGTYVFSAHSEDIIKVRFVNDSIVSNEHHAPEMEQLSTLFFSETAESVELITPGVKVVLDKTDFSIRFFDHLGQLKLVELGGLSIHDDSTFFNFGLSPAEAIYGTGFRALPLNRRGQKLLVYNRPQYGYGWGEKNLNYTIPHWTSSNNYGLLIDNPARANLDLGATDSTRIQYASKGGNLVYYFIQGGDQKELLENLTALTGRQPLPPRWSFGNLQSRFGYRNQQEAEKILDQSLSDGYPVDGVILDIYWFGPELEDGQMGRLDWDLDQWPDPKKMIEDFSDKGVQTIVVTEPFFTKKSKHYKELSEKKYLALNKEGVTYNIPDFYFGVGGLLDVFKPEARNWMWEQYRYIRSYGVNGLWVDLGEPEKHPHDMQHVNGAASQIHGIYGHEWARMIYEGYNQDYPEERVFHMGRSGFVGTQRYGLIPWTGDVSRSWSGLEAQLPAIMSMGLSGLGYMHSDAGGFSMIEKGDPILYIRWLQLSAFTSLFRPHADAVVPPEPVFWDELTQKYVKTIIDMRYSLLPYHYTLAYQNNQTGLPFVRPMILEFPEAPDTLDQQFMYGENLLVAPVTVDANSKSIYLPAGTWYDYFKGRVVIGNRVITKKVAINEIPVYARAGSVIPTSPNNQHAGSYSGDQLKLTYYLDSLDSSNEIYFDDGLYPQAIENNEYELLKIKVNVEGNRYRIQTKREGDYPNSPAMRTITFEVVGMSSAPLEMPEGAIWDEETNILSYTYELTDQKNWSMVIE